MYGSLVVCFQLRFWSLQQPTFIIGKLRWFRQPHNFTSAPCKSIQSPQLKQGVFCPLPSLARTPIQTLNLQARRLFKSQTRLRFNRQRDHQRNRAHCTDKREKRLPARKRTRIAGSLTTFEMLADRKIGFGGLSEYNAWQACLCNPRSGMIGQSHSISTPDCM